MAKLRGLGLPWVRWTLQGLSALACVIGGAVFGSTKFGVVGGIGGALVGVVVGSVLLLILTPAYPKPYLSGKPKSGKNIPQLFRIIVYIILGAVAGYVIFKTWGAAIGGAIIVLLAVGATETIRNPYFPEDDE